MNISVDRSNEMEIQVKRIYFEGCDGSLLLWYNTSFSCGIKTMTGIQGFFEENQAKFKEAIIALTQRDWGNRPTACMLQMSINDHMPELTKIMDELCTYKTEWHKNPSGGNNIRIYTFVV